MNVKSVLTSSAVLLVSALGLAACQSGSSSASDPTPSQPAGSPLASGGSRSAAAASGSSSAQAATGGSSTKGANGSGGSNGSGADSAGKSGGSGGSGGGNSGSGGSGSHATSDSYAYQHPCTAGQVRVTVTRRDSVPSQRVIEVRNTGADSCGLSYYPLISLDDSHTADGGKAVTPLVPSGLGGPPAFPVYAGRTVYAVVDLDPSGATSGTVDGIDELNVLADGDHMPNADTVNFKLGSGSLVLKPKLGLYGNSVADAVASMRSADTRP